MPANRDRYDWAAALAYFIALDPPRTRAAIARRFGMSEAAVRQRATREHWDDRAAEADRRAAAKAVEAATRTREARAAQTARILDRAQDIVEKRLTPDEEGDVHAVDEFVIRAWTQASRDYRLDIGEATDNVAIATVQAGFREAQQLAIELLRALVVDEALSGEVLVQRFRSVYPVQLVERLALIEGGDS